MNSASIDTTDLSTSAAARELAISEGTLRQWANKGLLPCSRLTNGTRVFRPSEPGPNRNRRSAGRRVGVPLRGVARAGCTPHVPWI